MDHDRLRRLRNYQSKDWYPAIFLRPLCIAVMWVVADWRFLTPNRLTTLANLVKVAAAALIFVDEWAYLVAGVVLLQLGALLDHMDGTLARYRRTFTSFGSFYDKVSDAITWFLVIMAIGWVAYRREGEAYLLILAAVHTYAFLYLGYLKWVAHAELEKREWHRARNSPAEAVAAKTRPPRISEPPERSLRDWLRWFGWSMLQIVRFEEMDLFFWVGLLLLLGQLEILLWGLAITQVLGVVIMLVKRGLDVHGVDRELRSAPAPEDG